MGIRYIYRRQQNRFIIAVIFVTLARTHPRLQYIIDWLMTERLGIAINVVHQASAIEECIGLINYTNDASLPGLWMPPSGFFDMTGVSEEGGRVANRILNQFLPVFSRVENPDDLIVIAEQEGLPDLFALAFFFLSRYEEYLPFKADAYGRFTPEQSLSGAKGLTGRAIVDEIVLLLRKVLAAKHPDMIRIPDSQFKVQSTIDLDQAWAYKHKEWRAFAGRLAARDWQGIVDLVKVWAGSKSDPFDTFGYIKEVHGRNQLPCVVFILAAAKRSELDKNHSVNLKFFRKLVSGIASWAETGVHPSAQSNSSDALLEKEIKTVAAMAARDIISSRQHFLLLYLPNTYRRLISHGILHDYSMGWADCPGYRAGTAFSFPWYDLQAEHKTELRIHPFQVMDVTLKNYLKLDASEAVSYVRHMLHYSQKMSHPFTIIWHNSSLDEDRAWKGWREVYESILGTR